MKVSELIKRLKTFPEDAEVRLEFVSISDCISSNDIGEIFETVDNDVCIQSF